MCLCLLTGWFSWWSLWKFLSLCGVWWSLESAKGERIQTSSRRASPSWLGPTADVQKRLVWKCLLGAGLSAQAAGRPGLRLLCLQLCSQTLIHSFQKLKLSARELIPQSRQAGALPLCLDLLPLSYLLCMNLSWESRTTLLIGMLKYFGFTQPVLISLAISFDVER